MKLKDVPGLTEAISKESFLRDVSFLPVTESICGVPVQPLTYFHMTLLRVARSPFLSGRKVTAGDLAVFLWVVSPEYNPSSRWRQWRFARGIRNINARQAVDEIQEYLEEAFADSPGSSGGRSISYYSSMVGLVDILASQYGWSERDILHLPLKRGYQYLKAITKRLNPAATLGNKSQELITQHLNRLSNLS